MYAIDLTRMARELTGTERLDCYTGALLASSAVPLVFRQVTVGGKPWLDGGVRQSVFVTRIQQAVGRALTDSAAAGRVYIILNGDEVIAPVAAVPPKLLPTVGRLRTLVFNQVELSSVYNVVAKLPSMTTFVVTARASRAAPPSRTRQRSSTPDSCIV